MIIIAVSGWRGWVAPEDRAWIHSQLVFWADVLCLKSSKDVVWRAEHVYWRIGDEPNGTDSVAQVALMHEPHCRYEADWSLPNKAGGPIRSLHMLRGQNDRDVFQHRKADFLLAFPQPGKRFPRHEEVSGTFTCMEQAKRYGITTIMPGYTRPEPEGLF